MTDLKEIKEERKNLIIFSAVSFLHDVGSDMVFSIWPVFVTQFLGANVATLGLIDGLGDALVSISQAVSGYFSDKLGRRKVFVWVGYLFGGIARIGYALSPTWHWLLPFRIIDRSGKMRGSPRDAIIAESSGTTNKGRNFGMLRMADNAGAVVGILLAMVLFPILGFRNLFLLAAFPSLIGVALIYLFIHDTKGEKKLYKGISFSHFNKNLVLYTLISGIFSLATFSYSFLLLFAKDTGFALGFVPVFYLLFTIVAAVFSLPFGKLSDKIGRRNVLFMAFFFWLLVPVLFLVTKNYFAVFLAFFFYGLHKAALDPVQTSLVSELAPKELLASTLGGFQLVLGVLNFPSSFFAGLLWQQYGAHAPFMVSLGLTVLALAFLPLVKERQR